MSAEQDVGNTGVKSEALGGSANDRDFGAFPYVIECLEKEIIALKLEIQRGKEEIKEHEAVEQFMIQQLRSNLPGALDECLHAHYREGSINPSTGEWVNDVEEED